jgi:hypothetical protein
MPPVEDVAPFARDSTPPHLVWWALLGQRVSEAKWRLPAHLEGRIRISVRRADFGTTMLTIDVRGPKTTLFVGDDRGDADVETSDALLGRLLLERDPPKAVFRVLGNVDLFHSFFHHLSAAEQPSTWLDIQARR